MECGTCGACGVWGMWSVGHVKCGACGVWSVWSVRHGNIAIRTLCCCFKALAFSFIPHCHSSLSCINEYLATGGDGYRNK